MTVTAAESFIANSFRHSAKSIEQLVVYGLNAYQFFGVGSGVVRQVNSRLNTYLCVKGN